MLAASINQALVGPIIVSFVGGYLFLAVLSSTLKGIYAAALYRYATTGQAGEHFDTSRMQEAFRPKKKGW